MLRGVGSKYEDQKTNERTDAIRYKSVLELREENMKALHAEGPRHLFLHLFLHLFYHLFLHLFLLFLCPFMPLLPVSASIRLLMPLFARF